MSSLVAGIVTLQRTQPKPRLDSKLRDTNRRQRESMQRLQRQIQYSVADKPWQEAEAAKASGGGASDWNKSGTTFEERDHTTWAKEELKNVLR